MLSTISARSFSGMMSRILFSMASKICSVFSIRVPAGARTWSWICPPSMVGKEVAPDEKVHHRAEGEDRYGEDRHVDPAGQQCGEELGIAVAQPIKTALEA